MIKDKTMTAVIPVRAGSQRVKNKNIKPFAGSSLLEIKIRQLLEIKEFDNIIVNSDSDKMLDIAKSLGVNIVKRDKSLATSEMRVNDLFENVAETTKGDVIFYTHVTNPLLKTNTIVDAINKYKNLSNEFDSICSVSLVREFLWQNGKAINYNPDNKPQSQDLPDIYSLNHAISILPRETMYKRKDLMGYKPFFYLLDDYEAWDIDTELDFEFAEYAYNKFMK